MKYNIGDYVYSYIGFVTIVGYVYYLGALYYCGVRKDDDRTHDIREALIYHKVEEK